VDTLLVFGEHEDLGRVGDVARESYDAGLEALSPGRTFGDVVDAMHKPLDARRQSQERRQTRGGGRSSCSMWRP
jgi:hypothetical protein